MIKILGCFVCIFNQFTHILITNTNTILETKKKYTPVFVKRINRDEET